jgi:transposase InsO family protein
MGRQTIYRRKNLTKQGMKEFIKPYLLNGLDIAYANQAWCTDITYIPMRYGFMYLTAIIDVYSRKIVGWGISNSLAAQWCKNVLQEAIFKIWQTRDHQQRSGYSVHERFVDAIPGIRRHTNIHGWKRKGPGQYLDRTVLEIA